MKVRFENIIEENPAEVWPGALLLCYPDEHHYDYNLDLYRIVETNDGVGLQLLHNHDLSKEDTDICLHYKVKNQAQLLKALKKKYKSILWVKGHIVIDRIMGELK